MTDSGHIIDHLNQRIQSSHDRLEMFEQLNMTLEEEKKTLLLQVNKLLEQVLITINNYIDVGVARRVG